MPSHVRLDPVSLATEPALWAAAGIVIGLYMFFRGFALLRRKLLIEGIPASTVRSAALGLVEVTEEPECPQVLVLAQVTAVLNGISRDTSALAGNG